VWATIKGATGISRLKGSAVVIVEKRDAGAGNAQ
jgi:hypothetical protein